MNNIKSVISLLQSPPNTYEPPRHQDGKNGSLGIDGKGDIDVIPTATVMVPEIRSHPREALAHGPRSLLDRFQAIEMPTLEGKDS